MWASRSATRIGRRGQRDEMNQTAANCEHILSRGATELQARHTECACYIHLNGKMNLQQSHQSLFFCLFLNAVVCLGGVTRCESLSAADSPQKDAVLYVATYSPEDGEGIFVATFDSSLGKLGRLRPTGGLKSPATLAIHPKGSVVYATTLIQETPEKATGGVVALAVDPQTAELREIDRRRSGGTGPCYLSIDGDGACLLVAHCGTASVACLQLQPDGRFGQASTVVRHVGESRNSEGKPQAHSIIVAPGNRFAIAADLGLDRLFVYRLEARSAQLLPHDPPFAALTPGGGPRHLAVHPRGRWIYAVNELGNTISAGSFNGDTGAYVSIQEISTLPAGFRGESYAAEIQVHPSGRYLYASNRGHDSLAAFAVIAETGRLDSLGQTPVQGKFPRHFAIDPSGRFLSVANQKSNQLAVFQIDPPTGRLTPQGTPIEIRQPVCVKFLVKP